MEGFFVTYVIPVMMVNVFLVEQKKKVERKVLHHFSPFSPFSKKKENIVFDAIRRRHDQTVHGPTLTVIPT